MQFNFKKNLILGSSVMCLVIYNTMSWEVNVYSISIPCSLFWISVPHPLTLKSIFHLWGHWGTGLDYIGNLQGELNCWSSKKKGTRQCCLKCCSCVTVKKRFASTFSRPYLFILVKIGGKIWEHNYLHKLFIGTLGKKLTVGQSLEKTTVVLSKV